MNTEQRFERGWVEPIAGRGYKPIGRMPTRSAEQIGRSPWSIGCETIDRGYVDFTHTGPHLGDLGATKARIQAGWARCEPAGDGRYDWAWLDAIVDGCVAQGVRPWLECSYGNPKYPGGGGIGLSEGLPVSPQALAAWDKWVAALAQRYADRVNEWEIWNEPENNKAITPAIYAEFYHRTASIVRRVQPSATLIGIAVGSAHAATDYLTALIDHLQHANEPALVDQITYHFYPHNPDHHFDRVEQMQRILNERTPHVSLRQGETGAPSETIRFMAMGDQDWNERKQAAWNCRRLLAHHARGIEMNLFQLADMFYVKQQGALHEGRNPKGQLCIRPDKTVAYRKPSFAMAQHVFSLFDARFELKPLASIAPDAASAAYVWTIDSAPAIVGWWRIDAPPALDTPPLQSIALPAQAIQSPLLLDVISGELFEPATLDWKHLPLADSPLLLIDRKLVQR